MCATHVSLGVGVEVLEVAAGHGAAHGRLADGRKGVVVKGRRDGRGRAGRGGAVDAGLAVQLGAAVACVCVCCASAGLVL